MLEKIVQIKNIGRFRNYAANGDVSFRELTLIYAENGRGKTTLCAILRSLQSGQTELIAERKTLAVTDSLFVHIRLNGADYKFTNDAWALTNSDVVIFDPVFINDNVYSGDYVEHEHKKNLYRVIVGAQVRTENSNKPHGFGLINPATFSPFPKNPVIARFFREIGWADELGSCVRKLMKYGKAHGGADPEMIEGDVLRIVVKVPEFGSVASAATDLETAQVATDVASAVIGQVAGEVTGEVIQLLKVLSGTALSRQVLQERLGLKGEANFRQRYLAPALSDDLIEMTQPDSPKSPTQKYRLTNAGKRLLESMQK